MVQLPPHTHIVRAYLEARICACVCVLLKGRPWKPDEIALILVREGGWEERGSYERGDKALLVAAPAQPGPGRDQQGPAD